MSERPTERQSEPPYVTCRCQHCDKGIEFDSSDFEKGETRMVECPHCHFETTIFVPGQIVPPAISHESLHLLQISEVEREEQDRTRREHLLPTLGLDTETTPHYLRDFVGQDKIKTKIQHATEISKQSSLPPGHIILIGPAGSDKTTLALLAADNIADATNTTVKAVNGFGIKYAGDLAGMLTNLEENDLLFVDDIDLLPRVISEYLEPALADFKLDIIIDEGPNARSVRLNLPRFTLIATATSKKRLSPMLQACFTTDEELERYSTAELADITRHTAKCFMLEIDQDATDLIVRSTNGTPSSVLNLIRHIRVYAKIKKSSQNITADIVTETLKLLESNEQLDQAKQARQGIPSDVRREVWRRDGGKCVKCGSRANLEYDHIIPISKGGANTARNIELLCENCNRAKHDSIL